MVRTTEIEPFVIELFDRLSERDLDAIVEVCADDCSVEIDRMGTSEATIDLEGMKTMYEVNDASCPDLSQRIVKLVTNDEVIAVFLIRSDIHKGTFRGIESTYHGINLEVAGLIRLEDGHSRHPGTVQAQRCRLRSFRLRERPQRCGGGLVSGRR